MSNGVSSTSRESPPERKASQKQHSEASRSRSDSRAPDHLWHIGACDHRKGFRTERVGSRREQAGEELLSRICVRARSMLGSAFFERRFQQRSGMTDHLRLFCHHLIQGRHLGSLLIAHTHDQLVNARPQLSSSRTKCSVCDPIQSAPQNGYSNHSASDAGTYSTVRHTRPCSQDVRYDVP